MRFDLMAPKRLNPDGLLLSRDSFLTNGTDNAH